MDINGISLEIERIGVGRSGRAPIVFLHEGLGSISSWKRFPDSVAEATGLIGVAMRAFVMAMPRGLLTAAVVFAGVNANQAADAGIKTIVNGPFTFGPDGNPMIGPVPGMTLSALFWPNGTP